MRDPITNTNRAPPQGEYSIPHVCVMIEALITEYYLGGHYMRSLNHLIIIGRREEEEGDGELLRGKGERGKREGEKGIPDVINVCVKNKMFFMAITLIVFGTKS